MQDKLLFAHLNSQDLYAYAAEAVIDVSEVVIEVVLLDNAMNKNHLFYLSK